MKTPKTRHRLTLNRLGVSLRPECSCGWLGVPGSKRTAESEYRAHRASCDVSDRLARRPGPAPRELTPIDALPEGLR